MYVCIHVEVKKSLKISNLIGLWMYFHKCNEKANVKTQKEKILCYAMEKSIRQYYN